MTAPNGRANGSAIDNRSEQVVQMTVPPAPRRPATGPQFSTEEIKELIRELEVPFDPAVIDWRVTNTTRSGKLRGQVIPYADPRAYTDRLNSLFTPGGWTRKYPIKRDVKRKIFPSPRRGQESRSDCIQPRLSRRGVLSLTAFSAAPRGQCNPS
jgi:hypothetical protein